MNEKATLKRKYKDLVRAGKIGEADKTLEKIWKMSGINKTIGGSVKPAKTSNKYTEKGLENMSFSELKVVGKKFGTTDRSKTNLIKEILALQ